MSTITTTVPPHDSEGHGHDSAHHDPHLAHHFDTPLQQFDAGKLGLWLFLTTEVLMFSGLFCAYAVYRAIHPEIFEYADGYLNWKLGALNTLVLIFSSFTMAWSVRAAQLGQKKLLTNLLIISFLCGAMFMVIKGIEYNAKFKELLLPGTHYNPDQLPEEMQHEVTAAVADGQKIDTAIVVPGPTTPPASVQYSADGYIVQQSNFSAAAIGPRGVAKANVPSADYTEPNNVQIFFSIYFIMTGLHGIHVLVGMGIIGWLILRAHRGDFGPKYFNPIDFTALYWHLVDLVWIFLFPLLYLIHTQK